MTVNLLWIKIWIFLSLSNFLLSLRLLATSQWEGRTVYNQDYEQNLQQRSQRLNTIMNALFIPFVIFLLGYCLFKIWRRKRKERLEREKIKKAVENLEKGIILCNNKHKICSSPVLVKKLYKIRIVEPFAIVYCNCCSETMSNAKKVYRCSDFCPFNLCKSCFKRATKIKNNLENGGVPEDKSKKGRIKSFCLKRKGENYIQQIIKANIRKRLVQKLKNRLFKPKNRKSTNTRKSSFSSSDDSEWETVEENTVLGDSLTNNINCKEELETSREYDDSKYNNKNNTESYEIFNFPKQSIKIRLSKPEKLTNENLDANKENNIANSKKRYSVVQTKRKKTVFLEDIRENKMDDQMINNMITPKKKQNNNI